MTEAGEPAFELGFLDEGRRHRAAAARRRRRAAIGVSVAITLGWMVYVTAGGQWGRVGDRWASAVTMVVGSFVAGSTPQGGGAVAFPVFTKGLEVPAEVARTFSLAIQTVGMGAATLAIVINRRRVEWRAIALGLPAAAVTFLAATLLLGQGDEPFRPSVIPGPYVKVSFTLIVAAMALVTYLGIRIRVRLVNRDLPPMNARTYTALVAMAAGGGLAAALTGSGADVFLYIYLAILLAVDPKVGVPTSVILMAGISLLGTIVLGVFDGQLDVALTSAGDFVTAVGGEPVGPLDAGRADLFGLWLAAVPVVAWGAPLGSWAADRLTARHLVVLVAALAAAEIITTVIFLDELRTNPALIAFAVTGAIVVGGGLSLLARNRRRFFALPGVAGDRSLSRAHLDVAADYRDSLEE